MFPLMIAYLMLILACLCIGRIVKNFMFNDDILSEHRSSRKMQLCTLLLAILGVYPQYRSFRTILMGWGFVQGDWETEHKFNSRKLYIIEPLVESLLQVSILCFKQLTFSLLIFSFLYRSTSFTSSKVQERT